VKRRYTFGPNYMLNTMKLGIAVIKGEKYYFITDRFSYWLITDMNPQTGSYELKLWDKPRFKKPHSRKSHWRNVIDPHAIKVRL